MLAPVLIGLLLSSALGYAAYRRRSLTESGVAGSIVIGTCVYAGGELSWWLTLFAFFATSTALGRVGTAAKAATKRAFSKDDRRDFWQAMANGGVAALAAVAYRFTGGTAAWAGAFVGALAACNADTWATELGILSRYEPRLITTLRRVPRGTSGGISPQGTAATAAGGAVIGLVAGLAGAAFHRPDVGLVRWMSVGAAAGVIGSLFDSLLGATLQAMYLDPASGKATERMRDEHGAPLPLQRGLPWLNNDWVNVFSSLAGAAVGALFLWRMA